MNKGESIKDVGQHSTLNRLKKNSNDIGLKVRYSWTRVKL